MPLNVGSVQGEIDLQDSFSGKMNQIGSSLQAGIGIALGERIVNMAEAAGAAILGFADNLMNMADEVTNTSAAFGASTEALQEFGVAGAAVGVSGEQIATGLRKLQTGLSDGNKEVENAVKFLGLSTQQLKDMKPEEQLQTILEATSKIPNEMDRTAVATELLGRAGAKLVPLGANLQETMDRAKELGIVMSADTIKAADDLGDEMGLLGMTFGGLKNNIASVIVESEPLHVLIEGLTDIFGELSVWVQENKEQLQTLVDAGIVFFANALVNAIDVVEVGMAIFKALADIWTTLTTGAKILGNIIASLFEAFAHPGDIFNIWDRLKQSTTDAINEASDAFREHQEVLDKGVGIAETVKGKFENLSKEVENSVGKHHAAAEAGKKHSDSLFKSAAAADAFKKSAEEAFKKSTEELSAFNQELDEFHHLLGPTVLDANAKLGQLVAVTGELGGVTKLSTNQLETLRDELIKQIQLGGESKDAYMLLAKALSELGVRAISATGELAKLPHAMGTTFGKMFNDDISKAFKGLPDVILQTIQGGGNIFDAVGSAIGKEIFGPDAALWGEITTFFGDHFGVAVAEAVGSVLPGIGALLGPALKGLGSLIGGLFHDEEEDVNDLRDAFLDTFGGWENLHQSLAQAGHEELMKKIFDADTVQEWQAAVEEVNSIFDTQKQAQEALNAAVEKYGFTIEELGPKFQQQQLLEQAQQLFSEFQLLTASGIDVNTVIERMGPAMNDFLHQAMATGQALPEAMRPMVDQFIESGQLIDENGDAFKSAEDAGITFSETLDQQFAKLIDRLNEFIDALMGVGSAHIPPINVPIQFNGEGEFETGHGIRFEPFAKGGVVTRPTLGLVGERGPEVIQPLDEVRKDRQRTIAEMRALMKEVRNAGTGGPVSVFIGGEKLDGVLNRRKRAGMLE
jgi:hypothetical protein